MEKQKGNINLIIILIIAVAIIMGVYLVQQRTNYLPKASINPSTSNPATTSSAIQNDNCLMVTSNQLDQTDLDALDKDLSQNDQDLANF